MIADQMKAWMPQTFSNAAWEAIAETPPPTSLFFQTGNNKTASEADLRSALLMSPIPDALRPQIWLRRSGAFKISKFGIYQSLLAKPESATGEHAQIELDITRSGLGDDEELQSSLRRVLRAYSAYRPANGYVQGMNFIASALLRALPDEESAFWLLVVVIDKYLPEHFAGTMAGSFVDCRVLSELLSQRLPDVSQRLSELNVSVQLLATRWFLTLWSSVLPLPTLLHVYDCLFTLGPPTTLLTSLACFSLMKPLILSAKSAEELNLTSALQPLRECTSHHLVATMINSVGELKQSQLDKLRYKLRSQANIPMSEGVPPPAPAENVSPKKRPASSNTATASTTTSLTERMSSELKRLRTSFTSRASAPAASEPVADGEQALLVSYTIPVPKTVALPPALRKVPSSPMEGVMEEEMMGEQSLFAPREFLAPPPILSAAEAVLPLEAIPLDFLPPQDPSDEAPEPPPRSRRAPLGGLSINSNNKTTSSDRGAKKATTKAAPAIAAAGRTISLPVLYAPPPPAPVISSTTITPAAEEEEDEEAVVALELTSRAIAAAIAQYEAEDSGEDTETDDEADPPPLLSEPSPTDIFSNFTDPLPTLWKSPVKLLHLSRVDSTGERIEEDSVTTVPSSFFSTTSNDSSPAFSRKMTDLGLPPTPISRAMIKAEWAAAAAAAVTGTKAAPTIRATSSKRPSSVKAALVAVLLAMITTVLLGYYLRPSNTNLQTSLPAPPSIAALPAPPPSSPNKSRRSFHKKRHNKGKNAFFVLWSNLMKPFHAMASTMKTLIHFFGGAFKQGGKSYSAAAKGIEKALATKGITQHHSSFSYAMVKAFGECSQFSCSV